MLIELTSSQIFVSMLDVKVHLVGDDRAFTSADYSGGCEKRKEKRAERKHYE